MLTAEDPASEEPAIDFAMMPYDRPLPSSDGALSSAAVLAASSDGMVAGPELRVAASAARTAFGYGRTVWAAVWTPEGFSWEFYWYRVRGQSEVTADNLRTVFDGLVEFDLPKALPSRPDVLSVDLGPDQLLGRSPVDHINIYSANPASTVHSGVCHRLDSSGATLTAIYHRFSSEARQAAAQQARAAIHLADRSFWPDLLPCTSIHIANKARRDAAYYGGITADQLAGFLARTSYHPEFASAVGMRVPRLSHLRFDVGTDFELRRVEPVKLAVYGIL